MKLVIAVIFALACHMAIADTAAKVCDSTAQYWNGNQCVACPDPCKECVFKNGKVSCINCGVATGKFLEIKEEVGICSNCIANCSTCRGPAVSDCHDPNSTDMRISPSAIIKCANLDGCLWCSSENKCGKCKVGYRLGNDTCAPCTSTFCADCSDSVSTCKKCGVFTELKNNTCYPCEQGCTSCPCTACTSGYRYFNNTCTKCEVAGCTACAANSSVCTACNRGTFLNSTTNTCQQCDQGCAECTGAGQCTTCFNKFGKNGTQCVACPDKCDECNGNAECTKCKDNFYASADKKTCTACSATCDGCSSPDGVCIKCRPGSILNEDKKACTACTTSGGCLECNNATSCKTCQTGWNTDGKGQCKYIPSCPRGKALDGNGTCVDGTIDNCVAGNNMTGTCFVCAAGYYANGKVCTPCPNGCESCIADSKGYVFCSQQAQQGFSIQPSSNGKFDSTGYLGKDIVYTVDRNGLDTDCMPYNFLATYTLNSSKTKCVAYDKCTILKKGIPDWTCQIEGNAVKMTLSLFAVVVATLFTL